jgi:hypothetical protein
VEVRWAVLDARRGRGINAIDGERLVAREEAVLDAADDVIERTLVGWPVASAGVDGFLTRVSHVQFMPGAPTRTHGLTVFSGD